MVNSMSPSLAFSKGEVGVGNEKLNVLSAVTLKFGLETMLAVSLDLVIIG
jgi:hypothetical protein